MRDHSWWHSRGMNFPDIDRRDLPKHNVMLEGILPLETTFLEAVEVEARQLGVSAEALLEHYAADLARVRDLDRENRDWREETNRRHDRMLSDLRERVRRRRG